MRKLESILILTKDGEFKSIEVIKTKEGSKTVWKYQAPKGIITFDRKKDMEKWLTAMYR